MGISLFRGSLLALSRSLTERATHEWDCNHLKAKKVRNHSPQFLALRTASSIFSKDESTVHQMGDHTTKNTYISLSDTPDSSLRLEILNLFLCFSHLRRKLVFFCWGVSNARQRQVHATTGLFSSPDSKALWRADNSLNAS